jgi:polyferredoxin
MNSKYKKISAISIARRIIQIAAFVLFPGLFISVLAAIKDIFTALIGGSFSFTALAPQLILAGGGLLITAIMGRFFCGFLCSFGAIEDLFWFIGRKLKLPKKRTAGSNW